MAQGIRAGRSVFPLNICGNEEGKDVAACIAGNPILPMQSLSPNPKIPFA